MLKSVEVDVRLTPKDLALGFANLWASEQAEFFNQLALETSTWDRDFCFQLQFVTESQQLSDEGRHIMRQIGQYADKE